MIVISEKGTIIRTKLVGTSKTKIQFNLFDMAIMPEKVDKSSFEIDLNTLNCSVKYWNTKINIGKLQDKYFEHIILNKIKMIDFKITGLNPDKELLYKNVGINVELQLLK